MVDPYPKSAFQTLDVINKSSLEIQPKVEYSLTDKGKEITKLIKEFEAWLVKYYPELEGSCES